MPALRTALRLVLSDPNDHPKPQPGPKRITRAGPPAKRRLPWLTGGGAVLTVVAASILAAPGTAHARTRATPTPDTAPTPNTTPAPDTTLGPVAEPTTSTTAPVVETAEVPAPASLPPYPVTQTVITLTDPSRATPARGSVPSTPTRSLRTLVLAPTTARRPLPVIVFAPGFDSEPETYVTLLTDWAAAGYLVLAPEAPGSARDLPGSPVRTDIAAQAQDLSFTVTAALGGVAGPVDATRITVAGHSDGGSAVATLALNPTYHDSRIASYIVLSGAIPDGVEGPWGTAPTAGRLLVVVGDDDEYGNLPASTGVYDTAAMIKTLVIARGGDHLGTYLADSDLAHAVRAATVTFLAGTAPDGHVGVPVSTPSLTVTQSP